MDLTEVITKINESVGDVVSLGLACLGVYVAIKAFTWIRSAMK